jgi:hypothetical protein
MPLDDKSTENGSVLNNKPILKALSKAELSDPFEQSLFKKMTVLCDLISRLNSLPHQKKRKRELVHFSTF